MIRKEEKKVGKGEAEFLNLELGSRKGMQLVGVESISWIIKKFAYVKMGIHAISFKNHEAEACCTALSPVTPEFSHSKYETQ